MPRKKKVGRPATKKKAASKRKIVRRTSAKALVGRIDSMEKAIWEALDRSEDRGSASDRYAQCAMELVQQVLKLTQRIACAEDNQKLLLSQLHRVYMMTDEEKRIRDDEDRLGEYLAVATAVDEKAPAKRGRKKKHPLHGKTGVEHVPASIIEETAPLGEMETRFD